MLCLVSHELCTGSHGVKWCSTRSQTLIFVDVRFGDSRLRDFGPYVARFTLF